MQSATSSLVYHSTNGISAQQNQIIILISHNTTLLHSLHSTTFSHSDQKNPSYHQTTAIMPSQTTTTLASPIPRRRSPLLSDLSLSLSNTLSNKAKSPYTFILRENGNDYSPPAPPPPSPVNFPVESWSTACSVRR